MTMSHAGGQSNVITAAQFELAVGHPPHDDDLDRANCKDAGHIAHSQCGWCFYHDKPRFICGCSLMLSSPPKPAPRWRSCSTPPSRNGIYKRRCEDCELLLPLKWIGGDRLWYGAEGVRSRCQCGEWLDDQGPEMAGGIVIPPRNVTAGTASTLPSGNPKWWGIDPEDDQGAAQEKWKLDDRAIPDVPHAATSAAERRATGGGSASVESVKSVDASPAAAHPLGARALEAAMAFRPDPVWSRRCN